MHIIDLTPDYLAAMTNRRSFKEYEALFPELFDHYFQFWCPRTHAFAELTNDEIDRRVNRVRNVLLQIESRFCNIGLDLTQMQIVLFVGGNTSNGHAFMRANQPIVWLPVETYATDHRALIFIAHEIIHGLHYAAAPEFMFSDVESKNDIGRQLITEGLATYLTTTILNVAELHALWADYLSESEASRWLADCREQYPALAEWFLNHFHESILGCEIFQANGPTDIWRHRAGYYVGLDVVRAIAERRRCSASGLLEIPRGEFEEEVIEQLKQARSSQ